MKRLIALTMLLLLLCGCAHVISEKSRALADRELTFVTLLAAPDAAVGKYIILGGLVAGVRNSAEGGQLEVIQTPLAGNGLPEDVSRSKGRFLAESPGFLDGAKYSPGRAVTLLGHVKGKTTRQLDGYDYTYPVVTIKEIYAWKYRDGKGYPPLPAGFDAYDDPYYHGYGVTPPTWFQRPTGPAVKGWQ